MGVGNRVFLKKPEPGRELLDEFRKIPAANIADVMGRSCAMNPRIKRMSTPSNPIMAGPALTVKTRPGDNLMIHQALNMAAPGDILVVSNESDSTRALMGAIMFTYAYCAKNLGGIILDGPLRDVEEVLKMDMPIYAAGSTPGGPYKEGPGEVNVPISCGEIAVNPGDIIVADWDGVIVVPLKDAEEILQAAKKFQEQDEQKLAAAANGTAKREWVSKLLVTKGTEIIDGYCV